MTGLSVVLLFVPLVTKTPEPFAAKGVAVTTTHSTPVTQYPSVTTYWFPTTLGTITTFLPVTFTQTFPAHATPIPLNPPQITALPAVLPAPMISAASNRQIHSALALSAGIIMALMVLFMMMG
ncbi:hypothetical protein BT63DRAFT_461312 [Microthyrium microscopicum]|uniref:Uncharacterized protein n=1 Tax=Microthyrium microscopicum TaxID=703497 RepID=A0A6A6TU52_9PEZI|nr:hypothetical protein BT63DRAFT_461312 [Microthyrium microscopicum]